MVTAFCVAGASSTYAQPQTHSVAQVYVLHRETNGIDGTLQLLMDSRLTPPLREELWGRGEWWFVLSPDSKSFKEFSALPPRDAKLGVRDERKRLVADRNLERPLAKMARWGYAGVGELGYLITVDYSAGFGSYSGPATSLLRVVNSALLDVRAVDPASGQEVHFRLMKALKSDWKMKATGNMLEILSFFCRPTQNGQFRLEYIRYSFDGSRWLEYKKSENGYWESDEPFPPRSAFP
jgi:hypothetical protein